MPLPLLKLSLPLRPPLLKLPLPLRLPLLKSLDFSDGVCNHLARLVVEDGLLRVVEDGSQAVEDVGHEVLSVAGTMMFDERSKIGLRASRLLPMHRRGGLAHLISLRYLRS